MSVYLHSLSRITCTESGDPEPIVTWTRNGTYFVNSNTLTINNVTLKAAGQYRCNAENRAGKISATVWIDVTGNIRKAKVYREAHAENCRSSFLMLQYYPIKFKVFKIVVFPEIIVP